MSYKVLHEAGEPHVCDIPKTDAGYHPGTVIECDECGVSYTLHVKGGIVEWRRRPKPSEPKPVERARPLYGLTRG